MWEQGSYLFLLLCLFSFVSYCFSGGFCFSFSSFLPSFYEKVSFYILNWPGTSNPYASASWMLGLQISATIPSLALFFPGQDGTFYHGFNESMLYYVVGLISPLLLLFFCNVFVNILDRIKSDYRMSKELRDRNLMHRKCMGFYPLHDSSVSEFLPSCAPCMLDSEGLSKFYLLYYL